MRNKYMLIGVVGIVVGVLLTTVVVVLAGSIDSPSGPTDSASQMHTLQQVYDRINNGTAATKMTTFTEPTSGPTSTMKTLDELYDLAGQRSRPAKTGDTYTDGSVTGEDGELLKGVTWPDPRFTDNNNGTVTDNLTGLMWMKNADAGNDCDGTDTGRETWADALASAAACNAGSGFAGYTDWRLPNVRELQSLVHYGVYNPAVPNTAGTGKWTEGQPFTGVQSSLYWSSTTFAIYTSFAWYVYLSYGYVLYDDKTFTGYVWPVRGGQ